MNLALVMLAVCWFLTLAAFFLHVERQERWRARSEERAKAERTELLERIMEPDYTKLVQARVAVQYGADIKRSLEEMTANAGREQEEVGR